MAAKRLTEQQLADAIGVPQPYVNKIKNGRHVPSVHAAIRFALALGVTVEEIWGAR